MPQEQFIILFPFHSRARYGWNVGRSSPLRHFSTPPLRCLGKNAKSFSWARLLVTPARSVSEKTSWCKDVRATENHFVWIFLEVLSIFWKGGSSNKVDGLAVLKVDVLRWFGSEGGGFLVFDGWWFGYLLCIMHIVVLLRR